MQSFTANIQSWKWIHEKTWIYSEFSIIIMEFVKNRGSLVNSQKKLWIYSQCAKSHRYIAKGPYTLIFMAKGVYEPRSEKIRLPGSPPSADSLSLSMPDWPVDINKIHDSKYWPIWLLEEKQSQQEEANQAISSFQIWVYKHSLSSIWE